jgi:hypothetical protein
MRLALKGVPFNLVIRSSDGSRSESISINPKCTRPTEKMKDKNEQPVENEDHNENPDSENTENRDAADQQKQMKTEDLNKEHCLETS